MKTLCGPHLIRADFMEGLGEIREYYRGGISSLSLPANHVTPHRDTDGDAEQMELAVCQDL